MIIYRSRKTHPGQVVHLSDCPVDPNKVMLLLSWCQVFFGADSHGDRCRYEECIIVHGVFVQNCVLPLCVEFSKL